MPHYHAFGLNFYLPFSCRRIESTASSEAVDLIIDFNQKSYNNENHYFKAFNVQDAQLNIHAVAHFHIQNGNKITITAAANVNMEAVLLFLFGSAFGILLYQRDYLVLHGCAIEYQAKSYCFVGPSGIGKSTLATNFMKNRFNIISDDVCAIRFIDGKPWVFPGFPDIKLWKTTLDKYQIPHENLTSISLEKNKYYLPLPNWQTNPVPLCSITQLNIGKNFGLTQATGFEKYQLILDNLYRPEFADKMNLKNSHFEKITSLSNTLTINNLTRPESGFQLDELTEFVQQHIFENIHNE